MKSSEIRLKFLDYFKSKNHTIVPSSSLIPANDPTLLFTNSGMVPFKDVFLGTDKRRYTRATSAQCCLRAGGKHNDLDNVGYTARHHTFFEMLGNFSFGDYFKEEAITMAWEFITQILGISKEKLTVTVHHSDQDAENIWINHVRVAKERVIRCGDKDNFWSMGETGPCGPCSEIFYDHGADVAGGPPGSPQAEGDRYIEIWNLVFMQFNRTAEGEMHALPKPSVDTGMGLERLSSVMQGVHNNYDTDLFTSIIAATAQLANMVDTKNASLRVIADHLRSASFLIKDSMVPSNEGRGYVLRRIIRRALRHGHKLNMPQHFFSRLVPALIEVMEGAYPDLRKSQQNIEAVLRREEEAFALTLDQGMKLLQKELLSRKISGELIFKLYDTYGFPVDLTADIAREHQVEMEYAGYEKCMQEQRQRSRQAGKFEVDYTAKEKLLKMLQGKKSEFSYHAVEIISHVILSVVDEKHILILDKTPFYPEGGGQVGDTGEIIGENFIFRVENTWREGEAILHEGAMVQGSVSVGDVVTARIDGYKRKATMRHHSATHLLHQALQTVLGNHVQQKGSLVAPDRLRFDFSHFEPITQEQLQKIEESVNAKVENNDEVHTQEMAIEDAKTAGAIALFSEKYGDSVRTIKMGTSFELCGGTHVSRTGDIGAFKIVSEGSIASGIRRIEAVAGALAWQAIYHEQNEAEQQKNFARIKQRELEKTIEQLKLTLATQVADSLLTQMRQLETVNVLVAKVAHVDAKALHCMVEYLQSKVNNAVIVLAAQCHDTACLVAGVTAELYAKIKAGDLVKYLAPHIDGQGGGRPNIAQAGGKSPQNIEHMLTLVAPWVQERMQ